MRKHNCPYYDENAPVCDDGDCGCYECYRRIEKLKAQKGESYEECNCKKKKR